MKTFNSFRAQEEKEQNNQITIPFTVKEAEETYELVTAVNGQAVTTSLRVAEYFGKAHKDVLKAIRALECSNDFQGRNFSPSFYTRDLPNGGTKKDPVYYMTRDGFTFLAMGFTGKVAAQFKENYINAFNQMEDILRSGQENRYALSILKSELAKVNKNLRRAITAGRLRYGNAYGPAGDIPSSFSLYEQDSFIKNVKNIMAHVNNALLTAYFLNTELQKKNETIQELEQAIKRIRLETAKVLGY